SSRLSRNLGFFLFTPLVFMSLISLIFIVIITNYQNQHRGRIYTGITVWGVDLSQMDLAEAEASLSGALPYIQNQAITLTDPATGKQWQMTPADLGLSFDIDRTVSAAYNTGRKGKLSTVLDEMFTSWYYGRPLAPITVLDEGKLDAALSAVAEEIDQPATSAAVDFVGDTITYTPSQTGRVLDLAYSRDRAVTTLVNFRAAEIELLVNETRPVIYDDGANSNRIEQIINGNPISFYIEHPLDEFDLESIILPQEEQSRWVRIEAVGQADGTFTHKVFLEESAARQWLVQFANQIYREPVNARYYFDDDTRELVLVSPHINGRELNVDATLAQLMEQIETSNRSVPFIVNEIVPTVSANSTAEELGIIELISERTTYFYGSSDARKSSISRSAANFFGIVIAPGEEFSFNKYLGSISEDDGYEEGLIIIGDQTIKGIGGGVCQVSTTVFQTVFWAGFPITERWQHGYLLAYYYDGEGPGMDATVYSPIVDFKFVNNTPYHLLIENYYNASGESLTFKFYSTSMGRTVEKEGPVFEDIVPAPPQEDDVWTLDPDLESGTVRQIDWATEGAKVTVGRTVYNADGEIMIHEDFVSNYVPWANGFMYGPEVHTPDYSLVPSD
ncbi:MAG: hypothetical protein GWP61_27225, partial [Chloroflexi bacterium]|nr:hypothetical protein [Chloroflexota bacterium]